MIVWRFCQHMDFGPGGFGKRVNSLEGALATSFGLRLQRCHQAAYEASEGRGDAAQGEDVFRHGCPVRVQKPQGLDSESEREHQRDGNKAEP